MNLADRINASFLLGALGDAFGAPLEGIRSLHTITQQFGPNGLTEMRAHHDAYGKKGVTIPAGTITDDTTMAMTTAAATILALNQHPADSTGFLPLLRHYLHQGYLNWGYPQEGGETFTLRVDDSIPWPSAVRSLWFPCGAGRGTIAALMQPQPGSVSQPLNYDCTVRGKRIQGPNNGCGGLMRVAPLAFLELELDDIFTLACESAAVTHGHPEAFVATGAIALFINCARMGIGIKESAELTNHTLHQHSRSPEYLAGIAPCVHAITEALYYAGNQPFSPDTINILPTILNKENPSPFLAVPVLAQVVYTLGCAEQEEPSPAGIKRALVLSANHSGDSDSVAAIVGNVLGARYGTSVIPADWLAQLHHKDAILNLAGQFHTALTR